MHIKNVMVDIGYDENDDDEPGVKEDFQAQARQLLIDSTRTNLEENLEMAKLNKHDVFIVSGNVICLLVNDKAIKKTTPVIDEARLLEGMLKKAHERRYRTQSETSTTGKNHSESTLQAVKNNISDIYLNWNSPDAADRV